MIILGAIGAAAAILIGVTAFILFPRDGQSSPTRSYTIVVVRNPPSLDIVWSRAHRYLEDAGYPDARMQYVVTEVATDLDSTKRLLKPLVEAKPDLIYTMGILATRAAKEVTEEARSDIPIVFAVASDPVGSGLVKSFQSSGNNLTGITPSNQIVASKRLEFVKEMLPDTKRIIYAWNDKNTSGIEGLRTTAPSLGLTLVEEEVADVGAMVAFLESFAYKKGDVILRASDAIGGGAVNTLIALAIEKRLPLVGTHSGDVARGALMSYGADYEAISRQSVRMVDAILKGTKPADIPIEEAESFELAVNTDTAEKISVGIPASFMTNVKHVYPEE